MMEDEGNDPLGLLATGHAPTGEQGGGPCKALVSGPSFIRGLTELLTGRVTMTRRPGIV